MVFNGESGILFIHKCICTDENLHAKLTFQGLIIPFAKWFRSGYNCTLARFNTLDNFVSYIKNESVDYVILKELNLTQHYKSQGQPKYSSVMIKFALLLR